MNISDRNGLLALIIFNVVYFTYTFLLNDIVPRALDNALVISKAVSYSTPTGFELYFRNSFNLPTQLAQFMLFAGFSFRFISLVLVIMPVFVFSFVSFFISRLFVGNFQALIVTLCYAFIGVVALTSPDYPVNVWSEHTFGSWGTLLMLTPICLLIYRNYFFATFTAVLCVLVHLITGIFILSFLFLYLIITKNFFSKRTLFSFCSSLIFVAFFVVKYVLFDKIESLTPVDHDALESYREFWQTHRPSTSSVKVILLYLVIVILGFYLLRLQKDVLNEHAKNSLRIVLALSLYALALYAFKPTYPSFIMDFMPGRFLAIVSPLLSVVGIALFLSVVQSTRGVRFWAILGLGLCILYASLSLSVISIRFHPQLGALARSLRGEPTLRLLSARDSSAILPKEIISVEKSSSLFISAPSVTRATMYRYMLAPLFDPTSFDIVNYHPSIAFEVKKIVLEIYGVDFSSPPIKNSGGLRDLDIKMSFSSRDPQVWSSLAKKYGFCFVSTPDTWELDLPSLHRSNGITIYDVCRE